VNGVQSSEHRYWVWSQNRSALGRWLMNYMRRQARGITLETEVYKGVRFRSCGTMGYGPRQDPAELWLVWVKSREGGDILYGHDRKACRMIACQLCRQPRRYQGRRMKRTIFLLVETRRTCRQSSRPSVVTGMLSTVVTGSY
jgi:hypothetical protein